MTVGGAGAIAQPAATFHVTADEEHRVRAGAHGIAVEVWRRVTMVMIPIDRLADLMRDTCADRAQLPLPLVPADQPISDRSVPAVSGRAA